MRLTILINVLVLCALPGLATAQGHDCAGEPDYQAFDFWLGQWAVHDSDGKLRGHNRITSVEGGCALREEWRSVGGNSGQSLNYFSPQTGLWRQLWVDSGGHIIDLRGALKGKDMLLIGTIRYPGESEPEAFRGRWSPLGDGRVRQFFEQRDTEGEWRTWFEGYYSRSGTAATAGNSGAVNGR